MVKNRKAMVFGVTVLGVMLALASVAFACTIFKGKFVVTAGGGTSKAWGKNSGMVHCTGDKTPTSGAKADPDGATITVEVFPTGTNTTDCPSSQLNESSSSQVYRIYYVNLDGFTDENGIWEWDVDCMASVGVVKLQDSDGQGGKIYINSNGRSTTGASTSDPEGSRSYSIASGQAENETINGVTDRAGVCISDDNAIEGNQVPLQIVQL